MKKITNRLIICGLLAAFCSCLNVNKPDGQTAGDSVVPVAVSISGVVKDTDGEYLSGVKVKNGHYTTETDENGFFHFDTICSVNNRLVLSFSKKGYFSNVRSTEMYGNGYVDVQMQAVRNGFMSCTDTFKATSEILLTAGKMQVHIPANSLVDQSGKEYSGQVLASVLYLSPAHEDFASMMPGGDMAAVTKDSESVILYSYGMVKVDLKDTDQNKLQLKAGSPATLIYPIPRETNAMVHYGFRGREIPLWHFNDETGLWIEEDIAIKTNDTYTGKVSHFSWWNLDDPAQQAKIEGIVTDCKGNKLSRIKVSAGQTSAYTDAAGKYEITVPENIPFDIAVKSIDYGNYDKVQPLSVEGAIGTMQHNITLPCLPEMSGKINNTCGDSLAYSVQCEYYVSGKRHLSTIRNYDAGNSFLIRLPFNAKTKMLNIVLQNGQKIQFPTSLFNGQDLVLEPINVCVKKKTPELDLIPSTSMQTPVTVIEETDQQEVVSEDFYSETPTSPPLPSFLDDIVDNGDIVMIAEKMPEYPGGEHAMQQFIAKNLRYPAIAQEHGVQGRVIVKFIVEKDGSIKQAEIIRSPDPALSAETLRVISLMPKWTPGEQNGKKVRVSTNLPLTFSLAK